MGEHHRRVEADVYDRGCEFGHKSDGVAAAVVGLEDVFVEFEVVDRHTALDTEFEGACGLGVERHCHDGGHEKGRENLIDFHRIIFLQISRFQDFNRFLKAESGVLRGFGESRLFVIVSCL